MTLTLCVEVINGTQMLITKTFSCLLMCQKVASEMKNYILIIPSCAILAASPISTSSIIINGLFPPSSNETFFKFESAAAFAMIRPTFRRNKVGEKQIKTKIILLFLKADKRNVRATKVTTKITFSWTSECDLTNVKVCGNGISCRWSKTINNIDDTYNKMEIH